MQPPFPRRRRRRRHLPPEDGNRDSNGWMLFPMIGKKVSNDWKNSVVFSNDWKNISAIFQ
ncbi:MAG: hypothetical protein IKO01_08070 [Kiritimatiellae bacterium]|nr:hypothetical protein [Kiritimatiellia bacterium]